MTDQPFLPPEVAPPLSFKLYRSHTCVLLSLQRGTNSQMDYELVSCSDLTRLCCSARPQTTAPQNQAKGDPADLEMRTRFWPHFLGLLVHFDGETYDLPPRLLK